jgi:hypothetical protein
MKTLKIRTINSINILPNMIHNLIFPSIMILICISCSSDNCSDDYVLDKVKFYNTYAEELSDIEFRGFEKGSNFEKLVDSSYIVSNIEISSEGSSNFDADLNKNIRTKLDYLVTFKSTGRTCQITEILVNEKICNDGLIQKEYSKSFKSYMMNGDPFACQILKIFPRN